MTDASEEDVSLLPRRESSQAETVAANRSWWDREAADYADEHGHFLGDADLVWGPEGWTEEELRVLGEPGDLAGTDVLEFGGGGAQGGRWCAAAGARVVSSDLSAGMLRTARRIDARSPGPAPALLQAEATRLPFADDAFDIAFSAYGATPFVADSAGLMVELARVLRPGGRLAFSTSHPFRWGFPDLPGEEGLTATGSYFDETPYVEGAGGRATYVEHHRTMGHRIAEIIDAGLVLEELHEPEWPADNEETWGGWSPLRGSRFPGTAIFVATLPRR
ncbi:MAG TPA: class I SAM-dependent methyltransferase [Dietzia timorensis]|uniref:Class I SAM-dependent methyltransferase n=1 Tax=Dietzia timorensis TaxID=499555 RepID=A0A921F642_9ACTN|nr:class I SAM-dependent methyltransferase [Dietzia timorensis]HJE91912.1 class I SAM-dependent methyltransferase [Dietzia timorensis]